MSITADFTLTAETHRNSQKVNTHISLAAASVVGHSCESDQFECNYSADGCIPTYKVRDGNIDCMRDAFDETEEAFKQLIQVYPEGEIYHRMFICCLSVDLVSHKKLFATSITDNVKGHIFHSLHLMSCYCAMNNPLQDPIFVGCFSLHRLSVL